LNTFEEKAIEYKNAIEEKEELVNMLRAKNFNMLNDNENIDIYNGIASFVSSTAIEVSGKDGKVVLEGEKIFINTGASTIIPNIKGINDSKRIYTSTTIMDLKELPKNLVIVGGGYIGLEFASIYSNFGSNVTVIETSDKIAKREDDDIADSITDIMTKKGISFIFNSKVKSFEEKDDEVIVSYIDTLTNSEVKVKGDAVLVATGRKPNIEGLNLDAAGVKVTDRGAVAVDNRLKTNVENIWALGDVNGGPQFT
ncbi:FAD-dependent oxidoreductase, partial [Cetobacterium sp.]|uniref:FAD-dependent oxidoreductase n=1 Tax=Cetobacterium sp. TaxID=2071632 RepID=UPI002FC973E2